MLDFIWLIEDILFRQHYKRNIVSHAMRKNSVPIFKTLKAKHLSLEIELVKIRYKIIFRIFLFFHEKTSTWLGNVQFLRDSNVKSWTEWKCKTQSGIESVMKTLEVQSSSEEQRITICLKRLRAWIQLHQPLLLLILLLQMTRVRWNDIWGIYMMFCLSFSLRNIRSIEIY